MDNNIWKETIQNLNEPLGLFFSELAKQKVNMELADASSGDKDQTLEYVEGIKLFKSIDDGFQVEILLGFKGDWPAVFQKPLQERGDHDKADHLFSSLTAHLTVSAVESMNRIGADLQIYPFSEVKKDPSLNIRTYYLSRWSLQVPESEHSEGLEFVFIISVPNKKMVEKYSTAMANSPELNSPGFSAMAKQTVAELLGSKERAETEEQDEPIEDSPKPKAEEEPEPDGEEEVKPPHITDKNGHGATVEFEPFIKSHNIKNNREVRNIDMLRDVEMEVSVELGRKKMPLGKILQQVKGSVIELDKLSGEPVDILVNGRCIALGDVVVIDEHFGVRITRLMAEHELMKSGSQ
ncbi:MAG: flagellar motor switch protein FliN [Balneolales bacterium]